MNPDLNVPWEWTDHHSKTHGWVSPIMEISGSLIPSEVGERIVAEHNALLGVVDPVAAIAAARAVLDGIGAYCPDEWMDPPFQDGRKFIRSAYLVDARKASGLLTPAPLPPPVSISRPKTAGELKAIVAGLPDNMPLLSDDGSAICHVIVGESDGKLFISSGEETEDWK